MNNSMPNVSSTMNAASFSAMQEQMKKMISEAADSAAKEIGASVNPLTKPKAADIKKADASLPQFNDNYVQSGALAALFRFLREEYSTAYMRVESIQADKAMCLERVKGQDPERAPIGNCRSDVEYASVCRSLDYYDTLEQRLEEVISGIEKVCLAHAKVAIDQRHEDDARQQNVAANERKYMTMPQLRWVSNADKETDPKNWDLNDDIKAAHRQAERFIEWNWNR